MKKKLIIFQGIAIIFSVIFALTIGEMGLRLYKYVLIRQSLIPEKDNVHVTTPPYKTPGLNYGSQDNFAQMIYHPVLGYRPMFPHVGRGYYINNQGFRYPADFELQKEENEVRIFILGGSFGFGAGCPDGFTFFEIMEKWLKAKFPERQIRVISASVGAYNSLQEFLYFTTYIHKFSPDVVIFVSGWNDVYFGLIGKPVSSGNDYLNYSTAIQGCIDGKIIDYNKQTFQNKTRPPLWEDYPIKLKWLLDKIFYQSRLVSAGASYQYASIPPATIIDEVEPPLTFSSVFAQNKKIKLLYVLQPDLYSTHKDLHLHEKKLLADYNRKYPLNQKYFLKAYGLYREKLPLLLKNLNIEYVDSEEGLSKIDSSQCFFVDHVHFGENGQKWFGEFLAARVAPIVFSDSRGDSGHDAASHR